jgi:hypothetical protein
VSQVIAACHALNYDLRLQVLWTVSKLNVVLLLLLRILQVIAACYALSLDLRLQVLWSAKSVVIPGGYNVDAMCRCA